MSGNDVLEKTGFSDDLHKAKNKLFAFSFVVLFILIFDPTLTGFLNNFSLKVQNFPILFVVLIELILAWFGYRYWLLLKREYPEVMNGSIKQITTKLAMVLTGNTLNEIDSAIQELGEGVFEKEQEFGRVAMTTVQLYFKTSNLKDIDEYEIIKYIRDEDAFSNGIKSLRQDRHYETDYEIVQRVVKYIVPLSELDLKKRREVENVTVLKKLLSLDVVVPFAMGVIAFLVVPFFAPQIMEKIKITDKEHYGQEYKIDSATVQVKNIQLKKVTQ